MGDTGQRGGRYHGHYAVGRPQASEEGKHEEGVVGGGHEHGLSGLSRLSVTFFPPKAGPVWKF